MVSVGFAEKVKYEQDLKEVRNFPSRQNISGNEQRQGSPQGGSENSKMAMWLQ